MKTKDERILIFLIGLIYVSASFLAIGIGFAEDSTPAISESQGSFVTVRGEILEVSELSDPKGAAIYTVKDLDSGETLKFFAHPYRTTIQMGSAIKSVGDILGGTKVSIVYRKSIEGDMPEVVFLKAADSYYS